MSSVSFPASEITARESLQNEIVFIENNVADYSQLIAGLQEGVEVYILDAAGDGLAQMAEILAGRSGIDAIHLFSHGSDASVQLGTLTLDKNTLQSRQADLATIGRSLSEGGDLLLYGCDIAQGTDGAAFIAELAQATGADVAASTDLTGAAAKGGDWVLEKETGQIDASAMLDDRGVAGFSGLLATVVFVEGSTEDLNIESGATSFAKTIDGATFTFASGSSAYPGSYFDIQTMNGIPGDGFAGVYALSARNAGGGVDFTITVENGYTFDLTGFAASASTGLIRVYYNGMASYKDFNLGAIDTEKNLSSLTDFNDVTFVTFSSENYALFQDLIITDVKAPPTLTTPSAITYTDTAADNTFSNQTGTLTASSSAVTISPIASYGISGGTAGGTTDISGTLYDVSRAGTYGTLYVKSSDGSYVYVPNATAINASSSAQNETFTVTATDNAAATSTATLTVNITGANDTPAITSGATATVAENSTGIVYIATASDADTGQTLSYSLGGTDASLFILNSSTGAVSFNVAPNYEVPSDAGGDNVYDITVTATDSGAGALNASRAVAITVTNVVELPTTMVNSAALSADTGSSLTDFITNTASQTISGTLTADLASGEKVEVSYDNGGSWSDATLYSVGSNSWSTTTTLSGTNTFLARVSNADGSGTAYAHEYVLDTTAPTNTVSTAGFSADTGSSNTDLITKSAAQTVSGTLSANLVSGESVHVSLDNGSTWTTATATAGSSAWSLTGQILSASSTLRVKVQDEAGNDGVVYSQAYVFDTTAPTTTVATASFSADTGSSSTDFNTSTAAQTISGTLSANLASGEIVYVSLDNGSGWTTATASVGSNAWSLADQTLTASSILKIKVTDAAGNDGSVFSQAYLLDTTAPTITFDTIRFSADTGSSNSDLVTSTAAQTITATLSAAPAGADVVYGSLDNGSTWTDITSKVSGTTLSWNGVTLAGSDTFLLRVVDAAGNVGTSTSQAYSLDTTAPPAPSTPGLHLASDTGVSNVDGITSITTPNFTGTAEVGSTVTLYDTDGVTSLGSAVATNGLWAITSSILAQGSHTLTAKATDVAGNVSAASSGVGVVIDTTAPTLAITSDVQVLKAGETANITFTFSEDPGASFTWDGTIGDVIVIGGTLGAISGSGLTRTATFTPTADIDSGSASITVPAGSYADVAGNNDGVGSPTPAITFDTLAPAAPSAPDMVAGSDSGASDADNNTSETMPTFTGTVDVGATVTLYDTDGITVLGTDTADGSGNWTITSIALTEGTHTLTTKASDPAGNFSDASSPLGMTIDTTFPAFSSATVNGTQLVLTYTETTTLDPVNVPIAGNFEVQVGSTPGAVTGVAVNAAAKTITLTLATAASAGQAVTVAYTDPTVGDDTNAIQDAAGNDADSFGAAPATNLTPTPPPPSPPAPPPAPEPVVDGVPVTTTTGDGGTTIITVPIVRPTRVDDPNTPDSGLADIPIVKTAGGRSILEVGVPAGVAVKAQGVATGLRSDAALNELLTRIESAGGNTEQLNLGRTFDSTVSPTTKLHIQTLTLSTGAGFDASAPIVVRGSALPGDGLQAVILDARALPSGSAIQVDNVDFVTVIGAVRIIGGAGQNTASGDGAAQYIVLGAEDDIIHGGDGNDTVGSKGGNDQVYGDAGDDIVFGGAGNDLLSGGSGSDRLNGGTGFDVALQEGKRSDYTITLDGAGIKLTHGVSGISDWLVDVEQVRFATGPSLTVAYSEAEEVAAFLFQQWMGREPTPSEGAVIQTLQGKTAVQVAELFALVFPQQAGGRTAQQLLEGMGSAGAIRVDAERATAFTGDAGDNTFTPTPGLAWSVDGGAGIDTVVFPASFAQLHIEAGDAGYTLQRMTDGAMLELMNVERLTLSDTKLALDLDGHAGQAAKLIGAVAGAAFLDNKPLVGEVIRALDAGISAQSLAQLGLQLLGASTPGQVTQLLWTNVVGSAATPVQLQPFVNMMAQGVTGGELAVLASNLDLNAMRIDLVGLAATGIEFA